jgi:hypothetical protein
MDWNDFNRELQNRVSDPGTRYCLGLIYERLLDIAKQMDGASEVVSEMANMMQTFVAFSEAQEGKLKFLRDTVEGRVAGVSVESEPLTNDDD